MALCHLDHLTVLLMRLPEMLSRVHRWTHFGSLPSQERETVLEHAYVTVLLASAMLALEETHGAHVGAIDRGKVLLAAAIHDMGEGRIGDVRYAVRQDPRVRDHLAAIEREQVEQMLVDLPEAVHASFWEAFQIIGTDSVEGRFFQAVERMGYMQYAVPQVQRGRVEFLEVFRLQHEKLLDLEKEFASVRMLYDPYRDYVAEQIAFERDAEEARRLSSAKLE
jgi:5'-deoxynucleotidase YfbR-like HD superfamily hydrolase